MSFTAATGDLVQGDPIPPAAWNQVKNDLANAIDGAGGGTYANSSAIQIDGDFRFGASKRPLVTSRDLDRYLPMDHGSGNVVGVWSKAAYGGSFSSFWTHTSGASAGLLQIEIQDALSNGNVIKTITARFDGATGGTLPAVMPILKLYRVSLDGAETQIATVSDTSASNVIYTAPHDISLSGISHTIDKATNRSFVALLGGTGGGAATGSFLLSLKLTQTVTQIAEV